MKKTVLLFCSTVNFFIITTTVIVGIFLTLASPIKAVKESLTISPLREEFKLIRGQQVGSAIKVKNSGDKAMNVELYSQLFSVVNLQYDYEFNKPDNKLAPNNWISFDKKEYHLEPKQQAVVNYQVSVPKDAEPGGHYVALFAQTKSDETQKNDVVEIKRVASLLYFEIVGNITKTGDIESFKTAFWQKKSPLIADLVLKNSGNTHYRVDGFSRLKNIFGREVSNDRVRGLLMPNTSRLFNASIKPPNLPGLYKLETQVSFPSGVKLLKANWVLYLPLAYLYVLGLLIATVAFVIFWKFGKRRPKP